ncbi:hypothetical protein DUNSADRAFT_3369 [Dunaliella salina]|uniref:Uncharacterized protein n=1 Tax=Dunaliella salina TaxID=3046 RepID=A0ABQ7GU58_DUNSA|nr:hypothetical protein DUNSADRAFT_3369 [Dunaliella salina]|eukprot:KAF5838119.1 hypothetical protein DUNSADRAFT_3369 [Dunaliella salina]
MDRVHAKATDRAQARAVDKAQERAMEIGASLDNQGSKLDEDDEEGEAEEGPAEDEDEDGLETEDEASEGEEEQPKQQLPFEMEDISFKEFAKRGELAPFSAVPARVDVPTQEEIESVLPRDDSKDMVIPEGAQVALNRQGYQAFQMGKIEFLVAETPDGKIDLKDSFIFDEGYEMYARPEISGELPELPVMMQPIPWVERKSGDFLKQKAPYSQMKKVYFVGVQSLRPYRMALDQVFKFESASRVLSREAVRTVGSPADPILRIRADGITIEDSGQMPTPSQMLQQGDIKLKEETEEEKMARIQEMEEKAEELDELAEEPDVPASDMM